MSIGQSYHLTIPLEARAGLFRITRQRKLLVQVCDWLDVVSLDLRPPRLDQARDTRFGWLL